MCQPIKADSKTRQTGAKGHYLAVDVDDVDVTAVDVDVGAVEVAVVWLNKKPQRLKNST